MFNCFQHFYKICMKFKVLPCRLAHGWPAPRHTSIVHFHQQKEEMDGIKRVAMVSYLSVLVAIIVATVVIGILSFFNIAASCKLVSNPEFSSGKNCPFYLIVIPDEHQSSGKLFNLQVDGNKRICSALKRHSNGTVVPCHFKRNRRSTVILGRKWYSSPTTFTIMTTSCTIAIILVFHLCLKRAGQQINRSRNEESVGDQQISKLHGENVIRSTSRASADIFRDREIAKVLKEENWSCAICLEDLTDIEASHTFEKLECQHTFHFPCWSQWVAKSRGNRCPLCNHCDTKQNKVLLHWLNLRV